MSKLHGAHREDCKCLGCLLDARFKQCPKHPECDGGLYHYGACSKTIELAPIPSPPNGKEPTE